MTLLQWNYETETYDEIPEPEDQDLPPGDCECGGQGFCRECRIWADEHGYGDWS